jgi:drug/metabolite transporter (DMT)-like permease
LNNLINFSIASLIWGSTWLAIKYQLGVVDPVVSIFYRFLLAGLLLLAFLYSKRLNMRYTASEHGWMALQGLFYSVVITGWFMWPNNTSPVE